MPRAVLSLTIPGGIWIGTVSQNHPDAQFQVLAATANDDGGVALAELFADDPAALIREIDAADSVTDLEVLEADGDSVLLQIETQISVFLESARRSGVPIETPFTVQDGEIRWELTVSRERLAALRDELLDAGISFEVESVYQEIDSDQLLTDRQWTVLTTALDQGYYDTPRTCTQEEIADAVGLAKSTCSETLHRAEERIIKRLVVDQSDGRPDRPSRRPAFA
ncbi:MAG: helix-turn-helix domain-containing protein [Halobacteriaceae archaeon]